MRGVEKLLIVALACLATTPVRAQRYAVVALSHDRAPSYNPRLDIEIPEGETTTSALAGRVEAMLEDRGSEILAPDIAAAAFEAQVSRPPVQLTAAQLDEVAPIVRRATMALSGADLPAAEVELRALGELRDSALEDLNRDMDIARRALDGCLLSVRARLAESDATGALGAALICARDHARIEPTSGYHPPAVRAVYREAERQLASRGSAVLNLEIAALPDYPMWSMDMPPEGPECISRINGVRVGDHPPLRILDLRPGRVRVQVECFNEPSRVHFVHLEPGENRMVIDPLLDKAITTDGRIHVHIFWEFHPDPTFARQMSGLAQAIGVERLVAVSTFESGGAAVEVWGRDGIIGRGETTQLEGLEKALDEALEEHFVLFTDNDSRAFPRRNPYAAEPSAIPTPIGSEPPTRLHLAPWLTAGGLFVVSSATLINIARWRRKDELTAFVDSRPSFIAFRTDRQVLLGLGLASLTTASVLTLTYGRRDGLRYGHYLAAGWLASATPVFFTAARLSQQRRLYLYGVRCRGMGCAPAQNWSGRERAYFAFGALSGAAAVGLATWGIVLDRHRGERAEASAVEVSLGPGTLHLSGEF